jgi:hypothetical protein
MLLTLFYEYQMGRSWRIGVDEPEKKNWLRVKFTRPYEIQSIVV